MPFPSIGRKTFIEHVFEKLKMCFRSVAFRRKETQFGIIMDKYSIVSVGF